MPVMQSVGPDEELPRKDPQTREAEKMSVRIQVENKNSDDDFYDAVAVEEQRDQKATHATKELVDAASIKARGPRNRVSLSAVFFSAVSGETFEALNKLTGKMASEEPDDIPDRILLRDLWSEVMVGLDAALLIYAISSIRMLARKGKIANPETVLTLPILYADMAKLISANLPLIVEHMGKDDFQVFEKFLDDSEKRVSDAAFKMNKTLNTCEDQLGLGVYGFGDLNQEKECVYAIFVNGLYKRIDVAFRGTVTKKDWSVDLNMNFRVLSDAKNNGDKPVKVHAGFYDYLFSDAAGGKCALCSLAGALKSKRDLTISDAKTKCDFILAEIIQLLDGRPGWTIGITGHSLGGALAQLFAFCAAKSDDPRVPKPINCITFASPKVGNLQFRKEFQVRELQNRALLLFPVLHPNVQSLGNQLHLFIFCQNKLARMLNCKQELEHEHKIRSLRVINEMDIIPQCPTRACFRFIYALFLPQNLYRAVGIQLKLLEKKRGYEVSYTKYRTGLGLFYGDMVSSFKRFVSFVLFFVYGLWKELKYHSCDEHFFRLRYYWNDFKDMELDDFYERVRNGETGILVKGKPPDSWGGSTRSVNSLR